jgi:hypothetical protein
MVCKRLVNGRKQDGRIKVVDQATTVRADVGFAPVAQAFRGHHGTGHVGFDLYETEFRTAVSQTSR